MRQLAVVVMAMLASCASPPPRPADPATTPGRVDALDEARATLAAARSAGRDEEGAQEAVVAELVRRFAGRISVSAPRELWEANFRAAEQVMTLWNPVLFPAESLERIMGQPTRRDDRTWLYFFDSGYAG